MSTKEHLFHDSGSVLHDNRITDLRELLRDKSVAMLGEMPTNLNDRPHAHPRPGESTIQEQSNTSQSKSSRIWPNSQIATP